MKGKPKEMSQKDEAKNAQNPVRKLQIRLKQSSHKTFFRLSKEKTTKMFVVNEKSPIFDPEKA